MVKILLNIVEHYLVAEQEFSASWEQGPHMLIFLLLGNFHHNIVIDSEISALWGHEILK